MHDILNYNILQVLLRCNKNFNRQVLKGNLQFYFKLNYRWKWKRISPSYVAFKIVIMIHNIQYFRWLSGLERSSSTTGIPSSLLDHPTWGSWWTNRGLGWFFWGIVPFSPATNFIHRLIHPQIIHAVHLFSSAPVLLRQSIPPLKHGPLVIGASSHPSTWPDSRTRDRGLTIN